MSSEARAEGFTAEQIARRDLGEGMDPKVYANAVFSGRKIFINVYNESDKPLEIKRDYQEYTLVAKNGDRYDLPPQFASEFFGKDTLAPKSRATFAPCFADFKGKKEDVKMIVCSFNLGAIKVVLLPMGGGAFASPSAKSGAPETPRVAFSRKSEEGKNAPAVEPSLEAPSSPAAPSPSEKTASEQAAPVKRPQASPAAAEAYSRASRSFREPQNRFFGDSKDDPEWLRRIYFGGTLVDVSNSNAFVETVQPIWQDASKSETFFWDSRLSHDAYKQFTYNLGAGWRHYLPGANALVGVDGFGDYQHFPVDYARVGAGFEWLSPLLEARVNGYFNVTPTQLVQENDSLQTYDRISNGLDFEIGTPIPHVPVAKIFAGGEFYDSDAGRNVAGWKTRLEIKPVSCVALNLGFRNTTKDPTEFRAEVRFNFDFEGLRLARPIYTAEAYPQRDLRELDLQRVERNYRIQKERFDVITDPSEEG